VCAQTFPPIIVFAIFDHKFVNIVAPPGDGNGHSIVHLKGKSFQKKVKTASKSTHKDTILVIHAEHVVHSAWILF